MLYLFINILNQICIHPLVSQLISVTLKTSLADFIATTGKTYFGLHAPLRMGNSLLLPQYTTMEYFKAVDRCGFKEEQIQT